MGTFFSGAMTKGIKNVLKRENTHVIEILMFNKNIKILFFELLGSIIYGIIENYFCLDFLYTTRQIIFK